MSSDPMQAMKEKRRFLLLASYCAGEDGCTDYRPCNDCLAMCNVFRVVDDDPVFDRELGPAALTKAAPPVEGSLLRAPTKSAPAGCYCKDICHAPVIMGRQKPCRRAGGVPGQPAPKAPKGALQQSRSTPGAASPRPRMADFDTAAEYNAAMDAWLCPVPVDASGVSKGYWRALDHIADFINSLDTSEMSAKQVRSAIYSECLTRRPQALATPVPVAGNALDAGSASEDEAWVDIPASQLAAVRALIVGACAAIADEHARRGEPINEPASYRKASESIAAAIRALQSHGQSAGKPVGGGE